jgi:hypothetical protein
MSLAICSRTLAAAEVWWVFSSIWLFQQRPLAFYSSSALSQSGAHLPFPLESMSRYFIMGFTD